MRNAIVIGLVLFVGGISTAAEPADWKLPNEDGKKLAARVKTVVARDNWPVTVSGNDITVTRKEPVAFVKMLPNSAPGAKPRPAGKRVMRYMLRFAPRMTTAEYEKLAAVNEESGREYERLHAAVKLPHKFDQFIVATPEEKSRVKAFQDAVAKLPRHQLPDFYTPEYSIFFYKTGDDWSWVEDDDVKAECDHVRDMLVRYFGMYSPDAAADGMHFGTFLPEPPR